MKRFKNIILGILAAGMLTVAAPVGGISAYASSAKISFSDPECDGGSGVQRQCEDLLSGWKSRGIRRGTFL